MKKLFAIISITLILGGFGLPGNVYAGEAGESGAAGGTATAGQQGADPRDPGASARAEEATRNAEAIAAQGEADTYAAGARGVGGFLGWAGGKALQSILEVGIAILEVLLRIVSWILWLTGILFNVVVREMVVEMGKYVTSQSAEGIRAAWAIMRDLANIGIIGGLIAVAVGTILHLQNVNAKTYLVRLIIAALLVNFSYFFAGAIIDSSNFLATAIYKSVITTKECASNSGYDSLKGVFTSLGYAPAGQQDHCTIADRFLGVTNLQGLRKAPTPVQQALAYVPGGQIINFITSDPQDTIDLFFYNLLLLTFELVTIFVFLSAITLLIGRFVALILILISSPLGVAGIAIPKVSGYAKKWWEALFSQALFAPIYFLLVGFSLAILANSKNAILGATNAEKGFEAVIGIVLTFIVATVFMLQSLRIAKQLSEHTKELASVYKASGVLAGWIPKAYTGGLKYAGNTAGTTFIGLPADRLSRGYERWMAKDGGLQKLIASTGVDRGIQKGINAVADAKFGGKEGYQTKLKEQEERRARLADVKKSRGNLAKSTEEGGLVDKNSLAEERRAKAEADSVDLDKRLNAFSKKKFKKDFADLTDAQKASVMTDLANDEAFKKSDNGKNLDKITKDDEKYKGKKWSDLNAEQREDLLKRASGDGRWTGKTLVKDINGNTQLEDSWEYKDRLQTKVDLRNDEERKQGKEKIIYQATLDDLRSSVSEVSMGQLKEEIRRNPKLLEKIARGLSENQRSALMKDDTISRRDKNAIRMVRVGSVMKEAQEFEKNVVNLEDALEMPPEKLEGRVVRGSKEYNDYRVKLHQTFKKYYQDSEVIDFFESDAGLNTGARDNNVLIDAVKNAVGRGLQESTKLSYGEKRRMRASKRMRVIDGEKINTKANEIFTKNGVTKESDKDKSIPEVIDEVTKEPISYEEFSSKYADISSSKGAAAAELFKATWLRGFARSQTENYFAGKAPEEIDSELKQEAFGKEMVGKHMRIAQLQASHKDQMWKDQQAQAMAMYGDKATVMWFKNTPGGQEYAVNWKKVDEERERLGLPSTDELLAS